MLIVSALLFAGLLALALYLISGDVLRLDRLKDGKAQVTQGPYSGPATLKGGIRAYNMGDYVSAKRILLPLAENGNAGAQDMIGLMYTYGHGVRLDEAIGCDWFERAALQNLAPAQFNLGICYEEAEGRAKDLSRALRWYDRAWMNGELDGGISAALIFRHSKHSEFIRRLRILAKEGHAFARTALWTEGDAYLFVTVSLQDIVCIVIMNGLLGYPTDHCDY